LPPKGIMTLHKSRIIIIIISEDHLPAENAKNEIEHEERS